MYSWKEIVIWGYSKAFETIRLNSVLGQVFRAPYSWLHLKLDVVFRSVNTRIATSSNIRALVSKTMTNIIQESCSDTPYIAPTTNQLPALHRSNKQSTTCLTSLQQSINYLQKHHLSETKAALREGRLKTNLPDGNNNFSLTLHQVRFW